MSDYGLGMGEIEYKTELQLTDEEVETVTLALYKLAMLAKPPVEEAIELMNKIDHEHRRQAQRDRIMHQFE